jgi:hypothetical protein
VLRRTPMRPGGGGGVVREFTVWVDVDK